MPKQRRASKTPSQERQQRSRFASQGSASETGGKPVDQRENAITLWFRDIFAKWPGLWLSLATIACLLPFVDKAFHIDDPLFLWAAQHIQQDPLDFYGFSVNWYVTPQPMSEVTKNPPLACYYIALVASVFGWAEPALHLAFLLPAVGVVWGTYRLAEAFCSRPALAALATLLTPGFLVSSTNLMCDTMMLCFWVWAIVTWKRGLTRENPWLLCVSGMLVLLSALTKYFGMSLIPLLAVYALMERRSVKLWLPALVLPALGLAGYQWATHELYGRGLLLDAADYATEFRSRNQTSILPGLAIGLTFTGACLASVLFYLPLLGNRRVLLAGAVLLALLFLVLCISPKIGAHALRDEHGVRWALVAQLAIFLFGGLAVLGLAVADCWRNRDAKSVLLSSWVVGTLLFAAFVNWTANGRSILPMVPAAALLVARRLDLVCGAGSADRTGRLYWPLLPAGLLALLVTWADYRLANSARSAAADIHAAYAANAGVRWFQGHWGFQWYMEKHGGTVVDYKNPRYEAGDLIVFPSNNTHVFGPPVSRLLFLADFELVPCPWLATMSNPVGAGFYSEFDFGPLPYALGSVPDERYRVAELLELLPDDR